MQHIPYQKNWQRCCSKPRIKISIIQSSYKTWTNQKYKRQPSHSKLKPKHIIEYFLSSKFCFWNSVATKSLQSCPTLCDYIDSSPPGSSVPGILQARTLEWVAISLSSAWKWKVKVKSLSCVRLLVTPWTAAYQAPLSMGFSRQEYWSGVPLPSSKFCFWNTV